MTTGRCGRATTGAVVLLLLCLSGCGDAPESTAPPAPPASGNVLDAADALTNQQEQRLNALIDERNAGTDSARIAVLTIENADGSIEDFAREVAGEWGVGDTGADNGVLVVADTVERELRIQTAEGVRNVFSDDEAEDIVENVLEPAFADERYAEGLLEAVDQIYLYADGQKPSEEPFNWLLPVGVLAAFAVLIGLVIASLARDRRRRGRIADEEIRAAEEEHPDLRFTEDQREAYRKYRYQHRKDDAVTNPALWLPLYISNPALYSAGSNGTASGSSFSGGGGFSSGSSGGGGGASGSY